MASTISVSGGIWSLQQDKNIDSPLLGTQNPWERLRRYLCKLSLRRRRQQREREAGVASVGADRRGVEGKG